MAENELLEVNENPIESDDLNMGNIAESAEENQEIQDNPKEPSNDEFSSNIFDDFSTNESLLQDADIAKDQEQKDSYYYINIAGKVAQVLFVMLLLVCIVSGIYIYIQKDETISDSSILGPVCFAFKDEQVQLPSTTAYCASISYLNAYYTDEVRNLKLAQTEQILSNITVIYEKENYLKSKDVTFLINESEKRLNMVSVIEKFDDLKKGFLGLEKYRVQCNQGEIDIEEKTFIIDCEAFSQSYENNAIVGFNGDPSKMDEYVSGTSVSLANSFINYIEKNSFDFTVIDRQTLYEAEPLSTDSEVGRTTGYTKRTPFTIKLKINY